MVDQGNFEFKAQHQKELEILEKAKLIRYNSMEDEWDTLTSTKIKINAILELL